MGTPKEEIVKCFKIGDLKKAEEIWRDHPGLNLLDINHELFLKLDREGLRGMVDFGHRAKIDFDLYKECSKEVSCDILSIKGVTRFKVQEDGFWVQVFPEIGEETRHLPKIIWKVNQIIQGWGEATIPYTIYFLLSQ